VPTYNEEQMMNRFAFAMMVGFVALIGLSATVYAIQQCGWHTIFLGKNTWLALWAGWCD
jgi:hypothetical protein